MKKTVPIALAITCLFILQSPVSAQGLLKKLKDKANDLAGKVIEQKAGVESTSSTETGNNSSSSSSSSGGSGRPTNKGGGGLTNTTPPDVAQQIADAEKAQKAGNFNEARFSVQQALLGVELQLGREILRSLPLSVSSLPADTVQDRVTSTSWGWSNLTILRKYTKGDKQLEMTVGNLPMYAGIANIYFSGVYSQAAGENPNMKQIKVKGNKALIKYEEREGYTVLVPLGQSGMIAWQGINFANEAEMMTAINSFDIDKIKKILGEK